MLINNSCSLSFRYLKYACGIVATLLSWIVDKPSIPRPFYCMATIYKYSVGQKLGNLTIISIKKSNPKSRAANYECKCDCGNMTTKSSRYFYDVSTPSCGCLKPYKKIDREAKIMRRLFHEKLHSASTKTRKALICSLSYEEFKEIIKQPCAYCGIEYSMERQDIVKGKLSSNTIVKYNGIDRVENSVGYTKENSVPCCTNCNLAKRTLSKQIFLDWVKRIYAFNFG